MKKQTKVKFSNSEHSSWYYLWDKSMCQLVQINPIFWKQIISKALSQVIGQNVNLCFLCVRLKIFIGRNNCESFSMFLYVVIEKMQLLGEIRRIRQKLHIFKNSDYEILKQIPSQYSKVIWAAQVFRFQLPKNLRPKYYCLANWLTSANWLMNLLLLVRISKNL